MGLNNLQKKLKNELKSGKGNTKKRIITLVLLLCVSGAIFLGEKGYIDIPNGKVNSNSINTENLKISYIDVGQGDAIYIKVNDNDILIDAGPQSGVDNLLTSLKEKNIDDFEYVIATHPHEDHIGGMDEVLKEYKVENFYAPKATSTTKTFNNMINAVKAQGLKIKEAKEKVNINLGNNSNMKFYSPIDDIYDNTNDYSPIVKLTYGENKFMFTGDAEDYVEEEVLSKYSKDDLESDVLKFGHHGSSSSSTDEFLKAVNPKYGVICVGADNKYGHPHRETVEKIKKYNIDTYRTDLNGEITIESDGSSIKINTEK